MRKFFSNTLNVILTIALISVLTCLAILAISVSGIGKDKAVIAEDFTGKSVSEVSTWIKDKKLSEEKYTIEYEYDETIPENILIYQSVKAGDPIKENITFVFSKGVDPSTIKKDTVIVPDFSTFKEEEIRNWGIDNLVNINIDYAYSDSVEKGKLISQSIKAGEEVEVDGKIDIMISNGKSGSNTPTVDGIIVPDTYIGYSEADFIKAVEALGLVPSKQSKTYQDKNYKNGVVYSYQSTSDGMTFKKGDTVKYYLVDNGNGSDTSTEVTVPDSYIGYKETDFVAAIEKLGLKASKQSKTYKSQKYATGTVYAYDSTSDGISFKKGDTVKYYLVDNGDSSSEEVIVPDSYIGYKEADFVTAIQNLGLKASKQTKTYTSQKYATGTVYVYDSTSDGIHFKKGDTVRYYLVDNGDSSGDVVVVPDSYIGYKEADFVAAIQNLGLKAAKQTKTYTSQKYATGTVYAYDSTSDGITFKKGDTVRYYLVDNGDAGAGSSSPGSTSTNVTLSDLVGKTRSEAETYLSNNGLVANIVEEYSNSVTSGKVMAMSPAAGTSVKSGSTVTITVSKGANSATILASNLLINNYSRTSFQEASNAIRGYFNDLGFTNVTIEGVSSTKAIGQIISIAVNGNTSYSAGDYPVNTPIKIQIVSERIN